MNKIIAKTVKKVTLLSVVLAVIVALAIVVTAVFGVNYAATLDDANSLTVTVNTKAYEDKLDDIQDVCENAFDDKGLDYQFVKYGKMSGDDCEIVYSFDADANLTEVKDALNKAFDEKTAETGEWNGSFISVTTGKETVQTKLPTAYVVRAAIAVTVFAVLAFAYVALRYRLSMGILVAACSLIGAVVAAAFVLLVRIPVTTSFLYIVALSAPVTAVFVLLTLNKLRVAMKSENADNAEDLIVNAVAYKEITAIAVVGVVALVLLGAIATTAVRWFALSALVAFVVTVFVGGAFAPALCLPLKKWEDKRLSENGKSGYVGAKKQDEE